MLDLCKSCKCSAVCTMQSELVGLSSGVQQIIESDKIIGSAIKDGVITWRQTFGCKYHIRKREGKPDTEIML